MPEFFETFGDRSLDHLRKIYIDRIRKKQDELELSQYVYTKILAEQSRRKDISKNSE